MKFIFFYSDLYEYYRNHIYTNLQSEFEVEAIKCDDLQNNTRHTFFGGVSIKIELILQKIKENMGKSIVFSDATIFINAQNKSKLNDFFNEYAHNDLCFADNDGTGYYNIGIILIQCNNNTLTFFENVLNDLVQSKGWDQDIVNRHLYHTHLKVDRFQREKIYCDWEFNTNYKDSYLIYKSFIHHDKNIHKNFNQRFDLLKKYDLITQEEYNAYYKPI